MPQSTNPPARTTSRTRPTDMSLTRTARWTAGGLGSILTGAGGTATFITENQVGTGALLLIGTLFLIAAISGRLPTRVQVGDNSVDYGAATDVLNKVAQDAPPEVAKDVIEQVIADVDTPEPVRQQASSLLDMVRLEAVVHEGLKQATNSDEFVGYVVGELTSGADTGWDFDVRSPDGKAIYVEVLPTRGGRQRLQRTINIAARQLREEKDARFIVIGPKSYQHFTDQAVVSSLPPDVRSRFRFERIDFAEHGGDRARDTVAAIVRDVLSAG